MKARTAIVCGALVGAAALAACGGGNSTVPAQPVVQCTYPTGTQVALAYPAPGATAVPDNPGQIVIAASPALPNTWQVALAYNGFIFYESVVNPIASSAVPTPYATPAFAGPTYESSGLGGSLPAATTVTVLLNNEASSCNSYPSLGTFTTQ